MIDFEDTMLIAVQIFIVLFAVMFISAFLWWLSPWVFLGVLILAGVSVGAAVIIRLVVNRK